MCCCCVLDISLTVYSKFVPLVRFVLKEVFTNRWWVLRTQWAIIGLWCSCLLARIQVERQPTMWLFICASCVQMCRQRHLLKVEVTYGYKVEHKMTTNYEWSMTMTIHQITTSRHCRCVSQVFQYHFNRKCRLWAWLSEEALLACWVLYCDMSSICQSVHPGDFALETKISLCKYCIQAPVVRRRIWPFLVLRR